jgi:hypothetical protein
MKKAKKDIKKAGERNGNHFTSGVNAKANKYVKGKHPRFSDRFLFRAAFILLTLILLTASFLLIFLILASCGTLPRVSPPEAHSIEVATKKQITQMLL